MKRTILTKLLTGALAIALLLPLAACGTKPPAVTDGNGTNGATDAPDTDAPIVEPSVDPFAQQYVDSIDARVESILHTASNVSYTGTAYYVSAEGNDENDGLTPETAWQSIAKVNASAFAEGDAVLFRRGDKFRTEDMVYTRKGVTYSAYGEGEKPMIMCSVDASDWSAWDATPWPNIYKCTIPFLGTHNVGGIIFDDGRAWGIKVLDKKNGDRVEQGHVFNGLEHFDSAEGPFERFNGLNNNLEFYHDTLSGTVYLYCDLGLPDEVFESIEICDRGHGFGGVGEDVVIDNIAVYGSGSLAIGYDEGGGDWGEAAANVGGIGYTGHYDQVKNVTVQNCAFYYTGGAVFIDYPEPNNQDYPLPYSDVVSALDVSARDFKVLNCSAVQIIRECEACAGEKLDELTLMGTTTEYLAAGLTAETAEKLNVEDFSTAMQNPTSGYRAGHRRVLVTADKVEDVIHLYPTDERQVIEGFGAQSNNESTLMVNTPEDVRKAVLDLLYDAETGLGFTLQRMDIPSEWLSPSEGVWNTEGYNAQLEMMKAIFTYNPDMIFMAVPWSPPGWMKTNGNYNGLTEILPKLKEECYDDCVEMFVHFVKYMEENGVHIKYLTLQNEPTANVHYGCCLYTEEELFKLTKMVAARFKEEGLTTLVCGIDGADAMETATHLSVWELMEEGTVQNTIGAITTHGYKYQNGWLNATNLERFGLTMIESERSTTVGGRRPYTNQSLMRYGNELWDHLQHGYNGWCFWWGERANWSVDTPEFETSAYDGYADDGESLFLYDPESGYMKISPDVYAIGQYSKFIRTGDIRVGANSLNPLLNVTCTKDPETGKLVVVVVNNSADDITVTVDGFTADALRLVRSGEGESWAEIGNVSVDNGVASLTFKAETVTTAIEQ